MLVGLSVAPADAATGCDAPDTTWVGPATEGGSVSWDEPTNWTNGVPTVESVVCVPVTTTGPEIESDATAATLTLQGRLTVDTSLEVGALEADGGTLFGGATTVTNSLTGTGLTLSEGAALDQWGTAVLGRWSAQGSRLTMHGEAVLTAGAEIDTLGGLFTIADTGSLTMDVAGSSAEVIGGFDNHGAVTVTVGAVFMMGAGGSGSGHPDEFSDGTFTATPDAELTVAYTELRTGARLDHLQGVDHITVPAGNTVAVADSTIYWDLAGTELNLTGAGELVATDHSVVGGRIGGSLTVRVPAGEVVSMDDAAVQDQARIRVDGELHSGEIGLHDDAVLDIYGTHRATGGGGFVDSWGTDPGVEIIHPEGRVLCDEGSLLGIYSPVVNHGTVDSGYGTIVFAPSVASPEPSSGTYRAGPPGNLYLGDAEVDPPDLILDQATIEGPVQVAGPVSGSGLRVRGRLETYPRSDTHPGGELVLVGTTTLTDGASLGGDVVLTGDLEADLGPTGAATLEGADVTGSVYAVSGTLSVPNLAPTTLLADGTLATGAWSAAPRATLDLPAVTTNDAFLDLMGPGASFGDGLATLTGNGSTGSLILSGGVDFAVPGLFRNEGMLSLSSGSLLDVGGKFRQLATGTTYSDLDSAGRGRVRAAGLRDLAGTLVVERDPAYKPPVGTILNFITSAGAKGAGDTFDSVRSPRYGTTRKILPVYDTNRVRLRVERVG
jgi:hypothetical protein